MAYTGFIVEIKELRKHINADRLQVATIFGNPVIVGLDVQVGDIGLYFPSGGQLSEKFCEMNNLVRKKDENGKNIGGYMDPVKRNVTAIKLRGETSDGIYMSLAALKYLGVTAEDFKVGEAIDTVKGEAICRKYIPRHNPRKQYKGGGMQKAKKNFAPLFAEHVDTEQLAYNMDKFHDNDEIQITLKMHGTSGRTGYLPVLKGYKKTLLDRILRREGKPIYEYDYVSGTRRCVLRNFEGGYYGNDEFRKIHEDNLRGKLKKGESCYYEIVGYTTDGTPIMGTAGNDKVNDKEFVKKYGETTVFNYGCEVGESKMYVYRMTYTSPDGDVFEYPPYMIKRRCEEMGVDVVPEFYHGFVPTEEEIADGSYGDFQSQGEYVKALCEDYYDGADPVGKTHVREGVVVRVVNRPTFEAYKHKNNEFKILSGIAIARAEANGATDNMSEDILAEM